MTTVGELLKKHSLHAKKSLGQNFLADPNLMRKLLTSLQLSPEDIVLEIGPGLSVLSALAANQCRQVVAIEKDASLLTIARQEFGYLSNLQWVEGDFLECDLEAILKNWPKPVKALGNVPYNISTPIVFKLLEQRHLFSQAVLTLQKEVVQRMVAQPGNKEYGILSVMLQSQARCTKLFDLPARCFIPPPEVTSSTIQIDF